MVELLVALIRLVPELLGILDPSHPVTQQVKDLLPEESASALAVKEIQSKS